MRRPSGGRPGPRPLREILAEILPSTPVGSRMLLEELQRAWEGITEGPVRDLTRVAGVRAGKVTIAVRSSPLLHELRGYRRGALLEALRSRAAPARVDDIVFRLEEQIG